MTCVYEDVENGLPAEEQGSKENAKIKQCKTRMSVEKQPKVCSLQWIEKIQLILGNPGERAEGAVEDREWACDNCRAAPQRARRTRKMKNQQARSWGE